MPYTNIQIPDSASFAGALLINNSAQVVWQGDVPRQIYLYSNQTGATQKISDNSMESRAGVGCNMNEGGSVVWDTYTGSGYSIFRYDGTTANINAGGQSSNNPDINDSGTIVFARYIWWQLAVFECQLVLYSNGSFTRVCAWPGSQFAIIDPQINNNGQIAFALYDGSARTSEVHLVSNGVDKVIGGPYHAVEAIRINSNGWVVWQSERISGPLGYRDIYLYDGVDTRKINPDNLVWCISPEINDLGQVVYGSGNCEKMDVYYYSQGATQNLSSAVMFNYDPHINNYGEIVWWGGAQWDSPSTSDIYYSRNGGTSEVAATSGARPQINGLGQIVYWDENARQLVLLTPTSPIFFLRRVLYWIRLFIMKLLGSK